MGRDSTGVAGYEMEKRRVKKVRFSTKAVHGGRGGACPVRSHVVPIYQTVNFEYEDFDQQLRVGEGKESGYFYTRYGNPTIDALNEVVADLEGGEKAFSFASGMAAITSAVFALVEKGDHILSSSVIYGGTYRFFTELLPRHGVDVTFVDIWDHRAVEEGFRPNTKVLYLEPLINPTLVLADLPALSDIARKKKAFVLADNTFTPPYLFFPLKYGADGVVHSTTKFIGGHGDTIGGIAVGSADFVERVERIGKVHGGVMSPMNAWLTLRGVRTLGIRLERSCENAMGLARFLADHPEVKKVLYPGLKTHPQHDLAKKLLGDFGCMVAFEVEGGLPAARRVSDAFGVITSTVSLGEVDTVAAHPASSSHKSMGDQYRRRYGITDGLLRLSVGIEDVEDLKDDLKQALDSL